MRFFFSKEILFVSWLTVFTWSTMSWNYLSFSLLIIEISIHVQKNLLEGSRCILAASFWRTWTLELVPPGILQGVCHGILGADHAAPSLSGETDLSLALASHRVFLRRI